MTTYSSFTVAWVCAAIFAVLLIWSNLTTILTTPQACDPISDPSKQTSGTCFVSVPETILTLENS